MSGADGTVTANGHQLVPFTLPPGPVSAWPRHDPGQGRPTADKVGHRRPDGTAFIVVALFAVAQVAVVAFSGSWQHQYELSVHLGQAHWVAGMQPLSVEGLIASATLVIWYAARYKHGVPLGAYLVLAAGVGQTVLMNVGADYRWPWLGPEISVWPAVAFVAAYEMAVWLVRKRQDGSGDSPQVTPELPVQVTPALVSGHGAEVASGHPEVTVPVTPRAVSRRKIPVTPRRISDADLKEEVRALFDADPQVSVKAAADSLGRGRDRIRPLLEQVRLEGHGPE